MKTPKTNTRSAAKSKAAATSTEPAHEHDHLVLATTVVQREFYTALVGGAPDPDSKITVTCSATPNAIHHSRHDRTLYTLSIKRATAKPEAPVMLSLLTLGLQAASHAISIRALRSSNNDAVVVDSAGAAGKPNAGAPVLVKKTGLQSVATGHPDENPIEDQIGFLQFSGAECHAEVFAVDRPERGVIKWISGHYGSGHDNTPPPADPAAAY